MITPSDFRAHLEMKGQITKGELAQRTYGGYTYDLALPGNWVKQVMLKTGRGHHEIVTRFVWLYMDKFYEGPAPLDLVGCDILDELIASTFIQKEDNDD